MLGVSRAGPVLAGVLLAACGSQSPSRREPPDRIVLVLADMLRRDHVGVHGGPATPVMDALARRGRTFDDAVASFHQTTMSMGALFTGRTPSLETGEDTAGLPWSSQTWCGMARFRSADETDPAVCMPRGLPTLAGSLSELGYETIGVVANRLLFRPLGYERGFDTWIEVDAGTASAAERRAGPEGETPQQRTARLRDGERVTRAAAAAVAGRRSDRFFLYVHYMDVHDYEFAGVPYRQAVAAFDRALGELLDELQRARLLEGTVVIVASDHGQVLDERFPLPAERHFGNPSFEPVLAVPLIVAPALPDATDHPVRTQDLRDLIVALAGGRPAGPQDIDRDEVFVSELHWQTYRRGRWKSARPRDGAAHHLFDLRDASPESRDVATQHPEVVAAHRERMDELSRRLAARGGSTRGPTAEDEERLRALGYL